MGLFDKIKDLFTDEEEIYETKEVEIEEQLEHKLPTFMRNKIEKEEREKEVKILEETKKEDEKEIAVLVENKEKSDEPKFHFDFDDDDFIEPTRFSRSVSRKEKPVEKVNVSEPVVSQTGSRPYARQDSSEEGYMLHMRRMERYFWHRAQEEDSPEQVPECSPARGHGTLPQ